MVAKPHSLAARNFNLQLAIAGICLTLLPGKLRAADDQYYICKLDYISGYVSEHRRAKTVLPTAESRDVASFSMFITNTDGVTHASSNFRSANGKSTTKLLRKGPAGLDALYRMCIGLKQGQSDEVRAKYFAQHQNDIHYILDESTILGPNQFSVALDAARNLSVALTGETRTRRLAFVHTEPEQGCTLVNCHERLFVRCAAQGTGDMVRALESRLFAQTELAVISLAQSAEVRKALEASGLTVIPTPNSDADLESILAAHSGKTVVLLAHLTNDAWTVGTDAAPSGYSVSADSVATLAGKHEVNLIPIELFPDAVDIDVGPAFINPFTKQPSSRAADVAPNLPTPAESIDSLKKAAGQATTLAEFLGLLPAGDLYLVADAYSDENSNGPFSYSLCHRSQKHEVIGGMRRMVPTANYAMALSIEPPPRGGPRRGKLAAAAALLLLCILAGGAAYKVFRGQPTPA